MAYFKIIQKLNGTIRVKYFNFFIEHIKHLFIIFTRINTHMCAAQKLPSNFKIELKTK